MRAALGAVASCCLLAVAGPASAPALVSGPTVLAGPSADVRALGGVAMADDGTGGAVFVQRSEGRDHIFAARFADGVWSAPQRVDAGQRFDSSWPAIGAGDGGRLVVVWAQEFGAADRLFSATLQPGARRFESPVPIDLNIGDAALGTYPSVSLNRGGQGYVTYRVITDPEPATVPPGFVFGEVRLARYTGGLWSLFGSPVNRNPAAPQRAPTAGNAPRIATDVQGNAIVAWHEADDDVIDRVYARRVFGNVTGISLQVSPPAFEEKPLRAGPDSFSLDVGPFGQGAVAWRQQPAPGAAINAPRVLVAQVPDVFQAAASSFEAPRLADGGSSAAPPEGGVGGVDVAVAEDRFATAFGVGATARLTEGDARGLEAPVRLDRGSGSGPPEPQLDLAPSGAAALSWRVDRGSGRGSVALVERRADGVTSERTVSGPRGGDVTALALAGTGLGDGAIAFLQGTGAGAQVVVAHVDAPPDVFSAQVPLDFVRGERVRVEWDPAPAAIGSVRYAVTVDDDTVADDLTRRVLDLPLEDLDDGLRTLQVIAADTAGQETTSVPAQLMIDRRAPAVRVRVRPGRRVEVSVSDGTADQVSGLDVPATTITIAGRRTRGSARVVRRVPAGRVRVVATVRDALGNRATVRRTVRVR